MENEVLHKEEATKNNDKKPKVVIGDLSAYTILSKNVPTAILVVHEDGKTESFLVP